MNNLAMIQAGLSAKPARWLVSGCAGFIGSNLLEALLRMGQSVVGLDNLSTGHARNLDDVRHQVGAHEWARFQFIHGDLRDGSACRRAVAAVDHVLHEAAPTGASDTDDSDDAGFVNLLVAARQAGVASFVYAASCAVHGDHPGLPRVEDEPGHPLPAAAVTRYVDGLHADVMARCDGVRTVGLRYFDVFGKRQDPYGACAALVPRWIDAMLADAPVLIDGDGGTSRDFCHVVNVVQANLLASKMQGQRDCEVYNIAAGDSTTLNQLHALLRGILETHGVHSGSTALHGRVRADEVRHAHADIGKALRELGYAPSHRLSAGLALTVPWYLARLGLRAADGGASQVQAGGRR